MSVPTLLRSSCLAIAVILAAGCTTEPAKPKLTPEQQAIAAMSYDQKAAKFLDLIHADKMTTPAYMQVNAMLEQLYVASKAPETKRSVLEKYQAQANTILDKAVGWDVLKPEVVKLYTASFTDTELAQLIEFYQSPTGQKMVKQLPLVTMQTDQLIQKKVMQNAVPQINTLIEDMAKDLGVSLKKNGRK